MMPQSQMPAGTELSPNHQLGLGSRESNARPCNPSNYAGLDNATALAVLGCVPYGPSRRSCPSAYGGFRSKQTQKIFGRPPAFGGVALYLAAKRPLDRVRERSRPLGHDRSAKSIGGIRYARFHDANNQDWSHCRLHAAPWQPHQLISGRAPSARTKILHTRGSSAPRWMGLVSRTADKANPASSVTHPSRLWPGSVGQTH